LASLTARDHLGVALQTHPQPNIEVEYFPPCSCRKERDGSGFTQAKEERTFDILESLSKGMDYTTGMRVI
jgi:hypothetical protein